MENQPFWWIFTKFTIWITHPWPLKPLLCSLWHWKTSNVNAPGATRQRRRRRPRRYAACYWDAWDQVSPDFYLVGGLNPSEKKMKVNWDDYSQYMDIYGKIKLMFQTTNQIFMDGKSYGTMIKHNIQWRIEIFLLAHLQRFLQRSGKFRFLSRAFLTSNSNGNLKTWKIQCTTWSLNPHWSCCSFGAGIISDTLIAICCQIIKPSLSFLGLWEQSSMFIIGPALKPNKCGVTLSV